MKNNFVTWFCWYVFVIGFRYGFYDFCFWFFLVIVFFWAYTGSIGYFEFVLSFDRNRERFFGFTFFSRIIVLFF